MRSRRARLEVMRDEGAKGAALALEQLAQRQRVHLGRADRGHDDLDRHRRARRARARGDVQRRARRNLAATASRSAIVARSSPSDHRLRAADRRRDGAEVLRDRPCRGASRAGSPGRCGPSASSSTRSSSSLTAVSNAILRLLGVDMSIERRGGSPDELKRLIAESYAGGHLDPGEAGMLTGVFHLHEQEARQVMTPIPAVVTRRRLPGRRDRAAAVRLQRPHPPGRHRGRRPRPRARARARQLARRGS